MCYTPSIGELRAFSLSPTRSPQTRRTRQSCKDSSTTTPSRRRGFTPMRHLHTMGSADRTRRSSTASKSHVRGQAHVNGVESHWSMLNRGYIGTCPHFSEKHLPRYVDEFSGRHNVRPLDTDNSADHAGTEEGRQPSDLRDADRPARDPTTGNAVGRGYSQLIALRMRDAQYGHR